MKRARLIIAAAAVLAIAIPSGVLATHSPNDGPKHDFAVGGGISAFGTTFGFAAQNSPNGATHGHGTFHGTTLNTDGHVTCLVVDGNRAIFETQNRKTGDRFGFVAIDNGEPVAGVPVDELTGDNTLDNCTAGPASGFPLARGNITIHDATP